MNRLVFPSLLIGFLLCTGVAEAASQNLRSETIPRSWKTFTAADDSWSIRYPRYWESKPKNGRAFSEGPDGLIGTLKSRRKIRGLIPNLTITEEALKSPFSPEAYSMESMKQVSALGGYTKISRQPLPNIQGELHIFSLKSDTKTFNYYYQVSTVASGTGVSFTAIMPGAILPSLESTIRTMFHSIKVKN